MAALTLAGGGAYYFAKREIDADRREKHLKRQAKQRLSPPSLRSKVGY